mmetsp:Transcript_13169/g.20672  ORF Transcript_13169/g.20672 Transcript_13169/m.20672 type:complete len:520 (-) Transcript_13169:60-1619(-)
MEVAQMVRPNQSHDSVSAELFGLFSPRNRGNRCQETHMSACELDTVQPSALGKGWIQTLPGAEGQGEGKASDQGLCVIIEVASPHLIVSASEGWSACFGTTRDQVCGRGLCVAYGPKTNVSTLRRICKNVANGQPGAGQTVLYDREGVPMQFRMKGVPCSRRGANGVACCTLSLIHMVEACTPKSVESSPHSAVLVSATEPFAVQSVSRPFLLRFREDIEGGMPLLELVQEFFDSKEVVQAIQKAIETRRPAECQVWQRSPTEEEIFLRSIPVADASGTTVSVGLEFLEAWEFHSLESSISACNDGPVAAPVGEIEHACSATSKSTDASSADTVTSACRVYMLLHQGFTFAQSKDVQQDDMVITISSSCGTVVSRPFESRAPLFNEIVELDLENSTSVLRIDATMRSAQSAGDELGGSTDILLSPEVLTGFTDDWVRIGDVCKLRVSFSFDAFTIQALKAGLMPYRPATADHCRGGTSLISGDIRTLEQIANTHEEHKLPMDQSRFKTFIKKVESSRYK